METLCLHLKGSQECCGEWEGWWFSSLANPQLSWHLAAQKALGKCQPWHPKVAPQHSTLTWHSRTKAVLGSEPRENHLINGFNLIKLSPALLSTNAIGFQPWEAEVPPQDWDMMASCRQSQ